jgi:hypothetical protein
MLKAFRKPGTLTDEGTRLANSIDDYTRQLTQNPLLDGRLIERVSITASAQNLAHGLNRPWRGWIITRRNGTASVYENSTQADNTKFITLVGSGSVTVDIYIF